MAYTNVLVLDRMEAKIEGTRGTAETTMTRPVVYPHGRTSWTWEADEGITAESLRSFHATDSDYTTVGVSVSRINTEIILSYEEAIWWMSLALKGGDLTGTTTGSSPAGYTHSLTPTTATDDLASATLKLGDSAVCYKFDRAMVNTMTLRFNPAQGGDAYWMASIELFARFLGTSSFDAPSAVTRHKIAAKGTAVYIDAFGGTIGSTAVTGAIRSGSVTINNQLEEKVFLESTAYTAADVARGEQIITFELVRELSADTEFAFARAGTTRKIRIQKTGDSIGSTPTTNYLLTLDLPVARYTPRMAPNFMGQNRVQTLAGRALRDSDDAAPIIFTSVIASETVTA